MEDKTLYEMILEKLGVQEDERFNIRRVKNDKLSLYSPHHFKDGYLIDREDDVSDGIFAELITGNATIEKLPWKPKIRETVYCIGNSKGTIYNRLFNDTASDLAMLKCEWVFKSYKEAEANKKRVLEEMKEVLGK